MVEERTLHKEKQITHNRFYAVKGQVKGKESYEHENSNTSSVLLPHTPLPLTASFYQPEPIEGPNQGRGPNQGGECRKKLGTHSERERLDLSERGFLRGRRPTALPQR